MVKKKVLDQLTKDWICWKTLVLVKPKVGASVSQAGVKSLSKAQSKRRGVQQERGMCAREVQDGGVSTVQERYGG